MPEREPRLADATVFVTGASRGIGRAIAQACAAEGAKLCLVATDALRLGEVAASLALPPASVMTIALDVADRDACRDAVARCEARFGRIDVLVNGAGIYRPAAFLDYSAEDFDALLRVNLYGTIHLMQAVLPGMIERAYGRIVNIASTAGKWASRNQSAYNVSKHAVVGLTRCVALEHAADGITVNAICPGFVQTDMLDTLLGEQAAAAGASVEQVLAAALARVPMGRALAPAEIASLAVWLASPESAGMTGQSLLVDGGMLYV